jgi:hypothetical protein
LLNDITLAVSYYKDSDERENNLKNFLKFYGNKIKIDVYESSYPHVIMENYNKLADRCTTKYIAFIDVDALLPFDQITKSIKMIESGVSDFVSPFTRFFNIKQYTVTEGNVDVKEGYEITNPELHDILNVEYKFQRNITYIGNQQEVNKININENQSWESPFFVGLCVITKLDTFYEFGMGNENFFVYGGADDEWYARSEKLGYVWKQVLGNIYHLDHERIFNEDNRLLHKNNLIELIKIITLNKSELIAYIKRCNWIKNREYAKNMIKVKYG